MEKNTPVGHLPWNLKSAHTSQVPSQMLQVLHVIGTKYEWLASSCTVGLTRFKAAAVNNVGFITIAFGFF